MKANITQSRNRSFTEKFIRSGFNVYVESNVTELADKWYNDNNLRSAPFKSKAWAKVMKACNKLNIKALRTLFGDNCDITYSHYTGCSMCPCSPGFRVRKCIDSAAKEFFNKDIWVIIKAEKNELSELKEVLIKASALLEQEMEEHAQAA